MAGLKPIAQFMLSNAVKNEIERIMVFGRLAVRNMNMYCDGEGDGPDSVCLRPS